MSQEIAAKIYYRAITMTLLSMRFEIELRAKADSLLEDDEEFATAICACIYREDVLRSSLTRNEDILIRTPIGTWPDHVHTAVQLARRSGRMFALGAKGISENARPS